MSGSRRTAPLALALAVAGLVGSAALGGCTDDGGPTTGAASTTSAAPGSGAGGSSVPSDAPGNTAPPGRVVDTCASITAADVTGLGVQGLRVGPIQDVSAVLQGSAKGGTGCLFPLTVEGTGAAGLTVLAHSDGGAYFDATVAGLADAEPIPGLGDDARTGHPSPGSTTVITRRGPLVVEARIGRDGILDRNLLIAIAGLALEREDGP